MRINKKLFQRFIEHKTLELPIIYLAYLNKQDIGRYANLINNKIVLTNNGHVIAIKLALGLKYIASADLLIRMLNDYSHLKLGYIRLDKSDMLYSEWFGLYTKQTRWCAVTELTRKDFITIIKYLTYRVNTEHELLKRYMPMISLRSFPIPT